MKKLQSIDEYFKDYSKEQIDEVLSKLIDDEKKLLILRYGEDLNNPIQSKLTEEEMRKFCGSLLPKLKRLLVNNCANMMKEKISEDSIKSKSSNEQVLSENRSLVKTEKAGKNIDDKLDSNASSK